MRILFAAAAFLVACGTWCRADEAPDKGFSGQPTTGRQVGAAGTLSPALLHELERILQTVLASVATGEAVAVDGTSEFELAARQDDDRDRPGQDDRRPPGGRRDGDRREGDRREGDRREGDRREGDRGHGDRGPDDGRHDGGGRPGGPGFGGPGNPGGGPGPGFGPGGGPGGPGPNPNQGPQPGPNQGPGHFGSPGGGPGGPGPNPHDGPPHTITVHIYLHHDFGGAPPDAMRMMMERARQGEMRGPPPGRRDRQRDDDDDDDDEEENESELESLRDDVASLRNELAELSALVRRLAAQEK